MDIQEILNSYFSQQPKKENNERNRRRRQRERAKDIYGLLYMIKEYNVLGRINKKENIHIPDPTQPIAVASLQQRSKKTRERTLDEIQQEAQKDLIYELDDTISLVVDSEDNRFIHAHGQVGLVDTKTRQILVPLIYDAMKLFVGYPYGWNCDRTHLLFVTTKEGKKWMVSAKGQVILSPLYDDITRMFDKEFDSTIKIITDDKEWIICLNKDNDGVYTVLQIEPFAKSVCGIEGRAKLPYLEWIDNKDVLHFTGLQKKEDERGILRISSEQDMHDDLLIGSPHHWRSIDREKRMIFSFLNSKRTFRKYDGEKLSSITDTHVYERDEILETVDERNWPYFIYTQGNKYGVSKRWMKEILPPIADKIISLWSWSDLQFLFKCENTWWLIYHDGRMPVPSGMVDSLWCHLSGKNPIYGQKDWKRILLNNNKQDEWDDIYHLILPTREGNLTRLIYSSSHKVELVNEQGERNEINNDLAITIQYPEHHKDVPNFYAERWKPVDLFCRKKGTTTIVDGRTFIDLTVHHAWIKDDKPYISIIHTENGAQKNEEIFICDLRDSDDYPF